MPDFDMNLIKPFIHVYEFNSFTKAAELLDVSQPAISASIKRLEDHLGYQLFIRSGRNLTATTSAQQFYQQVSSIVDVVDNALVNQQHFSISAPEGVLLKLKNLDNVILIESDNSEENTLHNLRMRKIDLAIDATTLKDSSFCFEPLHKESLVLICCKHHSKIQGSITLDQYKQAEHVVMRLFRQNLRAIEYLAKTPFMRDRTVKMQVNSPTNMMLAIQNTDYLAAIPEGLAAIAKSLDLQVLELPFDIDSITYEMIYQKRFTRDPAHQQLRDKVKSALLV